MEHITSSVQIGLLYVKSWRTNLCWWHEIKVEVLTLIEMNIFFWAFYEVESAYLWRNFAFDAFKRRFSSGQWALYIVVVEFKLQIIFWGICFFWSLWEFRVEDCYRLSWFPLFVVDAYLVELIVLIYVGIE